MRGPVRRPAEHNFGIPCQREETMLHPLGFNRVNLRSQDLENKAIVTCMKMWQYTVEDTNKGRLYKGTAAYKGTL